MLPLILPLLSSLLPDVLKRVLPAEKMSEEDRAKLGQEIQLELMKQDWSKIEAEFKDRDSARQLAVQDIAKGNAFTSALAAIVRPLWGIGCFVLVAYSVVSGFAITTVLQSIIETVLAFYFGGRVIEKLAPIVSETLKNKGK